jgi:HAD superfamily hydrolase (TIGR01458 family)
MGTNLDVKGVLLDIDGTLQDANEAIVGARDAVRQLRSAGLPLRFLTNTSRFSRARVMEVLHSYGIGADLDEVYTASVGASLWLQGRGVRRAAVCVPEQAMVDFPGQLLDEEHPEVVLVGDLGHEWTFTRLNQVFRWLLSGAELVAIHRNRYWRTEHGLTLDAGPFVAALEYATGQSAQTIGKPSPEFFETAVRSMGLDTSDVVMVGDDLSTDVAGAHAAGARAVLVRTGKFREEDLAASRALPDFVIDSIRDLPALLSSWIYSSNPVDRT